MPNLQRSHPMFVGDVGGSKMDKLVHKEAAKGIVSAADLCCSVRLVHGIDDHGTDQVGYVDGPLQPGTEHLGTEAAHG